MKRRIVSLLIAFVVVVTGLPVSVSGEEVEEVRIDLFRRNITDEQLAEMVKDGTIPKNVTVLNLVNNQISDITPLSELTNLSRLVLSHNQIIDTTPLAKLKNLESLSLSFNEINDISPLSELTNLSSLDLSYNQISDITPLSELTELKTLHFENNQISDISPLIGLINLSGTNFRNNLLTDSQIIEFWEEWLKFREEWERIREESDCICSLCDECRNCLNWEDCECGCSAVCGFKCLCRVTYRCECRFCPRCGGCREWDFGDCYCYDCPGWCECIMVDGWDDDEFDSNPKTATTLTIIPMMLTASVVFISRKRK